MLSVNHFFHPFSFIVVFVIILDEWFETGAVNAVVEIIEAFIDDPKMCEVGCNLLKMMLFGPNGKQLILFIPHLTTNNLTVRFFFKTTVIRYKKERTSLWMPCQRL